MEQIRAELDARKAPVPDALANAENVPLSTEEIMARVRAEVARRRAANKQSDRTGADAVRQPVPAVPRVDSLPRWRPAAARLLDQPQYVLGDFLRFDDADFIGVAYQTLLRRPPDSKGSQGYLDALRSGATSKVEILGLIRFSEEGRRQGVHVDGLLFPYKLHRWRHVRVIGWFVGMAMAAVRLPRLAWRLQGIEATAARETHEVGRLLSRVDAAVEQHFADVDGSIAALRAELAQSVVARAEGLRALQAAIGSTSDALSVSDAERATQHRATQEHLAAHDAQAAKLAEALRISDADHAQRHREAANRLTVHDATIARLSEQARADQRSVRAMLERLTVFLDAAARRDSYGGKEQIGETTAVLESHYASFEEAFRGEREEIKHRVAHYLDTLAAADIKSGDEDIILDLGSGRGEWLEVLAEHGYHGRGVDLDRGMLKQSLERGHDVIEADALDYLRAQKDGSVAAITSMHLVEHIPHPALIRLLEEALRVLRPGGVLILETPNPENVLVGSCLFYMDPTHLHPIPPPLLQWVVQERGFKQVVIERLSEHRGKPDLTPVSDNVPGAAQINQMIEWFTAPPDYAVIARKPEAGRAGK